MTESAYKVVLKNILALYTQATLLKLAGIRQAAPEKAKAIEVIVHPSQDEDGLFAIVAHLTGPDLFVLNKTIAPWRDFFQVSYINGQLQPAVPMFEPGEVSFSVNDAIVDVSIEWLQQVWKLGGGPGLLAWASGEEGYGTSGRVALFC